MISLRKDWKNVPRDVKMAECGMIFGLVSMLVAIQVVTILKALDAAPLVGVFVGVAILLLMIELSVRTLISMFYEKE